MTQWKLYATKHLMLLIYIKGNCSIRYQSLKTVCLFCICIQTATNLYFLELVTTRLRDVPRSKSLYTIVIRNIHSDNWLLIRYKLNYFVLPDKNEIRVIRRQRRLLGVIILAPFFLLIEVQSLVQHLIEREISQKLRENCWSQRAKAQLLWTWMVVCDGWSLPAEISWRRHQWI